MNDRMGFTKPEKKQLQDLAEAVYEAEAAELLAELDAQFALWRQGDLLSSELLREIHEFHQHQSRELWSLYQGLSASTIVERGISLGFIDGAAVSSELLAKLRP